MEAVAALALENKKRRGASDQAAMPCRSTTSTRAREAGIFELLPLMARCHCRRQSLVSLKSAHESSTWASWRPTDKSIVETRSTNSGRRSAHSSRRVLRAQLVVERDPSSRGVLLEVARRSPTGGMLWLGVRRRQRDFSESGDPKARNRLFNHGDGVRARAPRGGEDEGGGRGRSTIAPGRCVHCSSKGANAASASSSAACCVGGPGGARPPKGARTPVDVEEDERLFCGGWLRFLALWFLLWP